ncbi:hypothetical protein [Thorsellia anophelis]|uniref:Uncharacterized protein n=1 Tax=Thorsellia anophelis DSM 18579 TaxID=1123402 RepID=A0A1H9Z683_9GAMM|nr:hypothetical protein [Thorsellia anophelis]SES77067.1 hypothetical protein SAMN02583745_00442 [Thorsellia anophelis DSM 18579]
MKGLDIQNCQNTCEQGFLNRLFKVGSFVVMNSVLIVFPAQAEVYISPFDNDELGDSIVTSGFTGILEGSAPQLNAHIEGEFKVGREINFVYEVTDADMDKELKESIILADGTTLNGTRQNMVWFRIPADSSNLDDALEIELADGEDIQTLFIKPEYCGWRIGFEIERNLTTETGVPDLNPLEKFRLIVNDDLSTTWMLNEQGVQTPSFDVLLGDPITLNADGTACTIMELPQSSAQIWEQNFDTGEFIPLGNRPPKNNTIHTIKFSAGGKAINVEINDNDSEQLKIAKRKLLGSIIWQLHQPTAFDSKTGIRKSNDTSRYWDVAEKTLLFKTQTNNSITLVNNDKDGNSLDIFAGHTDVHDESYNRSQQGLRMSVSFDGIALREVQTLSLP